MRTLVALLLFVAAPVFAQCVITGSGHITDSRLPDCFPALDAGKCAYYTNVAAVKTVGASPADVADLKKHGLQIMKFSQSQACEGRANCGFYVYEFASEATCDGQPVQNMPGGEYRGLTSAAARNIQIFANRQLEQASKAGKERGDKTKNPKNKGKVWGAE